MAFHVQCVQRFLDLPSRLCECFGDQARVGGDPNSNGGINAAGTYGKVADWCGYFGKRKLRPDVVEGIVIMNHPENFGGNCPWFTRDYGHLSPSPFNFLDEPWTIEKDETLELKYRVVLFAGTPKEAGLDDIFKSWLDS